MIIVQEKQKKKKPFSKSLWTDIYFKSEEEAKDYIRENIKKGKNVEDFRLITKYYKCRTDVEFVAVGKEEKPTSKKPGSVTPPLSTPPSPRKVKDREKTEAERFAEAAMNIAKMGLEVKETFKKKTPATELPEEVKEVIPIPKNYTEDELKLLFFKCSCQQGRWAKTNDFDNADRKEYPSWNTFRYHLGSVGNVINHIVFELKREEIKPEYQKIIDKYFKGYTGEQVIKKLTDGRKAEERR